jgi:uncharacterized membrane protein
MSVVEERSSTGLEPGVAAALAYVVWWVTGLLIYLLERDSRFVKLHAMQSIVGLGGLWLLGLMIWAFSFVALVVSADAFHLFIQLANLPWIAGVILWLICLFKAYTGEWWKIPIAGDIAERIVGKNDAVA